MIKRHIITAVSIVLAVGGTVAAQAGVLPGVNQNQQAVPTGTQQQVEAGQARPDDKTPVTQVNEQPTADTQATDDNQTSGAGAAAAVPTPATTADDPAKIAEQTEPAPVQPPVVVRTGAYKMRFVDISPANKPNTKADQFCDYALSDGNTDSVWAGSVTYNFTQPIASYNENNLPGIYSAC